MIFKESILRVLDNSGAKRVLCIRVLRGNPAHGVGFPGARCVTTIKYAVPKKFRTKKKNLRKGEIHKVLLISSRRTRMRKVGHRVGGIGNYVIMLRRENPILPFANRLRGPIFRGVRTDVYSKITMMAANLI